MRPGSHRSIYVIGGDSGPMKIGISNRPEARAAELRYAARKSLKVLAQVDRGQRDARLVERLAHEILSGRRVSGEWFDVTAEEAIAVIHEAVRRIDSGEFRPQATSGMRLQVELSDRDAGRLAGLVGKTDGATSASIIRDALRIYDWVLREQAEGRSLAVETASGTFRSAPLDAVIMGLRP